MKIQLSFLYPFFVIVTVILSFSVTVTAQVDVATPYTAKNCFQPEDSTKSEATKTKSGVLGKRGDIVEHTQPQKYKLYQNFPNPFNPSTEISFSLEERAEVKLGIYNLLGQEVKMLISDIIDAGMFSIRWDGTDENGRQIPGGIYFYRLHVDEWTTTRKMIAVE